MGSDGKHPVPCETDGCPNITYRKCGKCRDCKPLPGFLIRSRGRTLPMKARVVGARRVGRPPVLCAPEKCPADYLVACAAELAKRMAERESAIAKVCRDLRAESA